MKNKIYITGTSGIGKSTLAKKISEDRGIPFINGSSTVLWKNYNINSHKELLLMGINDPIRGLAFQLELLELREKLVEGVETFVSDRSFIDNIVYFLYQNSPYLDEEKTLEYINAAIDSYLRINKDNDSVVLFLSRRFKPGDRMLNIENNGKRIINPYYQDMMDELFFYIIGRVDRVFKERKIVSGLDLSFNTHEVRDYNFEKRLEKIYSII